MRYAAAILWAAILIAWPTNGWSESVTLVASKDNSIFQNDSNFSNGGGAGIFSGNSGGMQGSTIRRGLLEFNIAAGVPAGAVITDVNLTLHLGQASGPSGNQTIELHRLTADWGEGTAGSPPRGISGTGTGSPASPEDATWSNRFFGQDATWSAPGGDGDYVPAISASTVVGTTPNGPYIWQSTPTLVSDVQGWLDGPSSNYGWLLKNENESQTQTVKAFYSRDATEINNVDGDPLPEGWNPSLDITYTISSEPSGDYNGNGFVDAADYILWRKTLNSAASPAGSGADGNKNELIDSGDYTYWRLRFGNPASGFASGSSVPEPASSVFMLLVASLAFGQRRR
jgi:hypothetical protein